jgi:hypothetical protein
MARKRENLGGLGALLVLLAACLAISLCLLLQLLLLLLPN